MYTYVHMVRVSQKYTKITTDITTAVNNIIGASAVRLQVTVVDKCTTQIPVSTDTLIT